MRIDEIEDFEGLARYLREFRNAFGDPVPYDVHGLFHLLGAVLDNLMAHHLPADLEDCRLSGPQLLYLEALVAAARNRRDDDS